MLSVDEWVHQWLRSIVCALKRISFFPFGPNHHATALKPRVHFTHFAFFLNLSQEDKDRYAECLTHLRSQKYFENKTGLGNKHDAPVVLARCADAAARGLSEFIDAWQYMVLHTRSHWFINHMKDHEALMEGPLTKLVPSMMRFEPPRQRGGPRHNMHGGMDMRGRPPPEGGDKYDSRYDPRFSDNGPGGMGGSGMDGMGGVPPPLFNMPDGGVGDAYGHDGSQSGMSGSHGSFSQDQSDRLSFASGMSQSLSQQSYSSAQSGNYGF